MAKTQFKVLVDNCTLGEKGKTVSIDDEVYNVPALVDGGTVEPVSKAAKEAAG